MKAKPAGPVKIWAWCPRCGRHRAVHLGPRETMEKASAFVQSGDACGEIP